MTPAERIWAAIERAKMIKPYKPESDKPKDNYWATLDALVEAYAVLSELTDQYYRILQFGEDNGIADIHAALKAYVCYQPTEARDNEIEAQADKWAQSINVNSPIDAENMAAAFCAGAHWADKQPTFNPFTTDYESR